MEKKICGVCKQSKYLDEFYKDKRGTNGVAGKCKICKKIHGNKHYLDNKGYYALKKKIWNKNNIENISKYNKLYNKENKDKIRLYENERYRNVPEYKVRKIINNYIKYGIKEILKGNFPKSENTQQILGCTFEEFKIYLESKFELWMNWDNHGLYNGELNYGWDIDHIIPISSAKTEEDVYKLNHYTNLQPLCSKINRYIKRDLI